MRRPQQAAGPDAPSATAGDEPEALRIHLLGGFQVHAGDRVIESAAWRLRKAASLVKLLALAPGHRLHREQAMDLLWPELDAEAAVNNLRYALHVARRTLRPGPSTAAPLVCLRGEQLALCPEGSVWVDAEAFEASAARARGSRDPAAYRAALELYTGELLPEDRYEEWAESRREGLRQTYLGLLRGLARAYEEGARPELAVETLQQLVAAEPDEEEAHVGLMRLLALTGRRHLALSQYAQLRRYLRLELDSEPDVASQELYLQILTGRFPSDQELPVGTVSEPRTHNLPIQLTGLIGRARERSEVTRLLFATRLLTLTGSGGCGKTRLAMAVATDVVEEYPDGVWLVELASLSDPALVPQAVAEALGVREEPHRPLMATLLDSLRSRQLLLVLDNCEHLLDACAGLAEMLLAACTGLWILATSREALRVPGELAWRVPSMALPDDKRAVSPESLTECDAARLFLERARSHHSGFELTNHNARAVAEICRRLDGIPLAIELAAARVGALSVEQIAARLDDCLRLLTSGSRTVLRQQTLRAALDWSYDLLNPSEQRLFNQLSAFVGGWTLEAAEAVGSGWGASRDDVLELLGRLVDKSLVTAEEDEDGSARYRLLEPVRQYGRKRLEESGEEEATARRHAEFYLALAEQAEAKLRGPEQVTWLDRLEAEHDNLRAALSWALDGDTARVELGLRLATAVYRYWHGHGHLGEGRRWLEKGLARAGDVPAAVRAKALDVAGWLASNQGDYERAEALLDESLGLFRALGDTEGTAGSLEDLGDVAWARGYLELARARYEESLELFRKLGDTWGIALRLHDLGVVAVDQGRTEEARRLCEESLMLHRQLGDKRGVGLSLKTMGKAALNEGDYGPARKLLMESLSLFAKLGNKIDIAECLEGLARADVAQGHTTRAVRLLGAATALRELMAAPPVSSERSSYESAMTSARARLDGEEWTVAWAEGRVMTLDQAVEYALSAPEQTPPEALRGLPAGQQSPALTPREREIAVLVARGLTNRRIAVELAIAERTVDTHVAHILRKLGLASRAGLAIWVTELQLGAEPD